MTRLGLTQRVTVVEEYGERRDCLDQAWTRLLEPAGYVPIPLSNEIVDVARYLENLALDGIILTSGNDLAHLTDASNPAPERDRFETAALHWAVDRGVPVLGVCRGLELLNDYFGGSLSRLDDHVATEHPVQFHSILEDSPIRGEDSSVPKQTVVNSFHDYGIYREDVGNSLTILGTAPDGTVECVVHETHPVCGIMWHPERSSPSTTVDQQLFQNLFRGDTYE